MNSIYIHPTAQSQAQIAALCAKTGGTAVITGHRVALNCGASFQQQTHTCSNNDALKELRGMMAHTFTTTNGDDAA